jgi:hypothetical protein
MNKKIFKSILLILLGMLIFFSCDNPVALGERLNLEPPVVSIIKPDFLENISDTLEITGTAKDSKEVAIISITVERVNQTGEPWKQEWIGERGQWQYRSNLNNTWVTNNENGKWTTQGGKGFVNWSIKISMNNAPNGEYIISVGAENDVKNKGPIEQRRVVIDNDPPAVTVLTPILEYDDHESEQKYSYLTEIKPDFDLRYHLQDTIILDKLHNKEIAVQYEIKDDFTMDYIIFQLADNLGNIYYNKDAAVVKDSGWSGKLIIYANEILDPDLRTPITEKMYFQLISTAADKAGNELTRSHGWLVWWPDADKPWTAGVGVENLTDVNDSKVFPGSEVTGLAYDNDGVQQVSYKIYSMDDTLLEEKTLINLPIEEGSSPSKFFSWSFIAPKHTGVYYIILNCKDINGLEGDQTKRYFYVFDVDAPDVEIGEPDINETLFGNENGKVTFSGVTSDGTMPSKLKMVWLNPKGNEESQFLYRASEYTGWNFTGDGDDLLGNKVWDLTPLLSAGSSIDPATKRVSRTFSKQIDLFADLGVGLDAADQPLSPQLFVFWVEGGAKAFTRLYTFRGDISPPEIDIAKIEIYAAGDTTYTAAKKSYTVKNGKLDGDDHLNAFEAGEKLFFSGTWAEDSYEAWKNGTINYLSTLNNNFNVIWNDIDVPKTANGPGLSSNGTWRTGPFVITDVSAYSGKIIASISDAGHNVSDSICIVRIETNIPYLMSIDTTLTKPDGSKETTLLDGSYNSGDVDIVLHFSKDVEFTGGTPPTLTLNTTPPRNAVYQPPAAASDEHVFRYTITNGDNTEGNLNVISINLNGGIWAGDGGEANVNSLPPGQSLAETTSIVIDTVTPKIINVESLSGEAGIPNYYTIGASILIKVTFDKDIIYTSTAGASAMTLNTTPAAVVNYPAPIGQRSLLFNYIVAAGQNAASLSAANLTFAAGVIKDLAGNGYAGTSVFTGINITNTVDDSPAKQIVIDTIAPAAPALEKPAGGGALANLDTTITPQEFVLTGIETGAKAYYSIDDGANWILYSGMVSLTTPGEFKIRARQIDQAGNISPAAPLVTIKITLKKSLVQSFSGSPSNTYGVGQTISININLSETVTFSNAPVVTLNIGKNASFTGTLASISALRYQYVVQSGDDTAQLRITSITSAGTITGANGPIALSEMPTGPFNDTTNPKGLEFYTDIKIQTDIPVYSGAVINGAGTQITLNFSKAVSKGNGNITITQDTANYPYLAPAVFKTRSEYLRYGGDTLVFTNGDKFYEAGTNGASAAGVAELNEKYILKYNYEISNPILTGLLTAKNAHVVEIPVVSTSVTLSGSSLLINLSNFPLPVKGVDYLITFDGGIVRDSQNNNVAALTSAASATTPNRTVKNPGVNDPFIRVQKEHERIQQGGNTVVVGAATFTTTSEMDPSSYWIKDADFRAQVNKPTEPGTWEKAASFVITIPRGSETATGVRNISQNTSGIRIGGGDQALTQGGRIQPGSLGTRNVTGVDYYVSDGWGGGGGATNVFNNENAMSNYYLDPYQADFQILYFGSPDDVGNNDPGGWGFAGTFYVRDLWVNTAAPGKSTMPIIEGNPHPNGYLLIGGAVIHNNVTVPTPNAPAATAALHAVQPFTTGVKIDCQTPGATITYGTTQNSSTPFAGPFNMGTHARPTVNMPGANATPYTTAFSIGVTTDLNGYMYGIGASAAFGGSNSSTVYETASRSVIMFNNIAQANNWGALNTAAVAAANTLHLWIRGGDDLDGSNVTPGFPMKWNENEHDGARLMTGTETGVKYWISWEVTVPVYFHFVAGTVYNNTATPAEVTDIQNNGPLSWGWAKNSWSFQHREYPLFPGGSQLYYRDTRVSDPATENFEFYNTFSRSR